MTDETHQDYARCLLSQVALAICALLAAGYPLAWGKLSDRQTASGELAQGALKTIVSASLLESSPGRVRSTTHFFHTRRCYACGVSVFTLSTVGLLDRRHRAQM